MLKEQELKASFLPYCFIIDDSERYPRPPPFASRGPSPAPRVDTWYPSACAFASASTLCTVVSRVTMIPSDDGRSMTCSSLSPFVSVGSDSGCGYRWLRRRESRASSADSASAGDDPSDTEKGYSPVRRSRRRASG